MAFFAQKSAILSNFWPKECIFKKSL